MGIDKLVTLCVTFGLCFCVGSCTVNEVISRNRYINAVIQAKDPVAFMCAYSTSNSSLCIAKAVGPN